MVRERQWLCREDWEKFQELFEKVEGTNWYDTRQLAIMLVQNDECRTELEKDKANITTILTVLHMERRKP